MFASRFFVRAYDYWYGYSAAQIELMVADQPMICYKKQNEKKTKKEMDNVADEWAKKHNSAKTGEKISLTDLLGGNVKQINPLKQ